MKSRVHPKYKTKYRVGNWRAYERALVQRGDVTLWLSADARDAWRPSPCGQPGGQRRFSDLAITTALTLRLVFRLPLRQAEGFLRSVLSFMDVDLEAPDHTTLSRRSRHLDVALHRVPAKGPIHLIVDSTADAAYDTFAFYHTTTARGATVVVPPNKTARVSRRRPRSRARDRTIKKMTKIGRRRWKKETGYHQQARVENAFFRYKSIIGGGLRARSPGGRVTEAVLACNILNHMTERGRPESYRLGR